MTRLLRAALVTVALITLAGCAAPAEMESTPAPTVDQPVVAPTTETVATAEPEPVSVVLDEVQRSTLATTFGVGTAAEQSMRDVYCPLDEAGRTYYADLVGGQLGYDPSVVTTYLTEWCGS